MVSEVQVGSIDRPGVAIIGLGIMGRRMLDSLTLHGGFRIVCAWDPDGDARARVARDHPDIQIVDTATTAVSADGVDVVYIACPPSAHLEYALMAAEATKAVYCEKPLGVDVAESESLVETFRERGLTNAVNFPFAANQPIDHLEQQLASGALGQVVGVELHLHFVPWPRGWQAAATWLAQRAEGGYVREVGSHFVFLVEKLFGPARLVQSSVDYPTDGRSCETGFSAQLDCSGVPVSLTGSSVGVGPDVVEFTIWGTETSMRLSNWAEVHETSGGAWAPQEIYSSDMRRESNTRFFDDLSNLLAGQPNTIASFEDALSVQRIVEAILAEPSA